MHVVTFGNLGSFSVSKEKHQKVPKSIKPLTNHKGSLLFERYKADIAYVRHKLTS